LIPPPPAGDFAFDLDLFCG